MPLTHFANTRISVLTWTFISQPWKRYSPNWETLFPIAQWWVFCWRQHPPWKKRMDPTGKCKNIRSPLQQSFWPFVYYWNLFHSLDWKHNVLIIFWLEAWWRSENKTTRKGNLKDSNNIPAVMILYVGKAMVFQRLVSSWDLGWISNTSVGIHHCNCNLCTRVQGV